MKLVSTKHPYFIEGTVFDCSDTDALMLIERGYAEKVQTTKKENNDEKVNDNSAVPHAVRGRGKRSKNA